MNKWNKTQQNLAYFLILVYTVRNNIEKRDLILNIRNINKKRNKENIKCISERSKAALGQPARIRPKAEPRRAQRSAQPWAGGSLVPPRQARERRTGLYTWL